MPTARNKATPVRIVFRVVIVDARRGKKRIDGVRDLRMFAFGILSAPLIKGAILMALMDSILHDHRSPHSASVLASARCTESGPRPASGSWRPGRRRSQPEPGECLRPRQSPLAQGPR